MKHFGRVATDVMTDISLSIQERGVYALLVCMCGSRNYCYPSITYLMELTELSRASIYRILKSLTERGYIQKGYHTQEQRQVIYNQFIPTHEKVLSSAS